MLLGGLYYSPDSDSLTIYTLSYIALDDTTRNIHQNPFESSTTTAAVI